MKFSITKTSDFWQHKEIVERESLEQVVNECLDPKFYYGSTPEVIISRPETWEESECDYVIEIYDDWRE